MENLYSPCLKDRGHCIGMSDAKTWAPKQVNKVSQMLMAESY